jgi:hypothetical protein
MTARFWIWRDPGPELPQFSRWYWVRPGQGLVLADAEGTGHGPYLTRWIAWLSGWWRTR